MKTLIFLLAFTLAGCNALGGIPDSAITGIANAGGGCVAVESLVMGKAVYMVASADKGVIRNGQVSISAACGGITITDTKMVPPVAPVK